VAHCSAHQIAGQALEGRAASARIQRRGDVDVEPAMAPRVNKAGAAAGRSGGDQTIDTGPRLRRTIRWALWETAVLREAGIPALPRRRQIGLRASEAVPAVPDRARPRLGWTASNILAILLARK